MPRPRKPPTPIRIEGLSGGTGRKAEWDARIAAKRREIINLIPSLAGPKLTPESRPGFIAKRIIVDGHEQVLYVPKNPLRRI